MTLGIGPEPEADLLVPVDLYREGDHYLLTADLPGLDPGSLHIDVRGQLLTISGHRTLRRLNGTQWLERDRGRGSLQRQVLLGGMVRAAAINGRYACGVLSILLPVEPGHSTRKIDVRFR